MGSWTRDHRRSPSCGSVRPSRPNHHRLATNPPVAQCQLARARDPRDIGLPMPPSHGSLQDDTTVGPSNPTKRLVHVPGLRASGAASTSPDTKARAGARARMVTPEGGSTFTDVLATTVLGPERSPNTCGRHEHLSLRSQGCTSLVGARRTCSPVSAGPSSHEGELSWVSRRRGGTPSPTR